MLGSDKKMYQLTDEERNELLVSEVVEKHFKYFLDNGVIPSEQPSTLSENEYRFALFKLIFHKMNEIDEKLAGAVTGHTMELDTKQIYEYASNQSKLLNLYNNLLALLH